MKGVGFSFSMQTTRKDSEVIRDTDTVVTNKSTFCFKETYC